MRCLVPFVSLVILCAVAWVATAQDPRHDTYRPYVGLWGANSKVSNIDYHRITSGQQMTKVWLAHVGKDKKQHSDYYNKAGVPEVDFGKCMVLVIFRGQIKNSAGVRIVSVQEDAGRILVRFDDRAYNTTEKADEVTPYGFFVLPRSGKRLVLEENVQKRIKGEPIWNERAAFKSVQ